ncbi:MAG: exodeoxyribonuclease III [Candidatus Poseidonia sp.]|nr:exodeoxyribonuclease III [Poseidonia sp.]
MRFVSWNVNGLRAAIRKGIDDYFTRLNADVMMLQEVRSLPEQLPKDWTWPQDWQITMHPAAKKGYSGVATGTRGRHTILARGHGGSTDEHDSEGRVLTCEVNGVICINTYLPSGSNKEERQRFKETWMEEWRQAIRPYLDDERPVVVCGDLNIAHTEDDIWNPKGNAKSSGFLPHEREWFTELLNDGWTDAFRSLAGEGDKTYSWWSNRGQARAKDRGWRIDYFLLNPAAAKHLQSCTILREGGLVISDHAPVILDLSL